MLVTGKALGIVALGAALAVAAFDSPAQEREPQDADSSQPTRLYPRKIAKSTLPRGDVLVIALLQKLADDSGEEIYVAPGVPPDASVGLERAVTTLDGDSVAALLEGAGLEIGRQRYKGAEVHWVRQPLATEAPRKRGSIVPHQGSRRSTASARGAASANPSTERRGDPVEVASLEDSGDPSIRIYQRIDGDETRFLVTIEADSAEQAEDIAVTVRALIKSPSDR